MAGDAEAVGVARAGAAFAARRKELGFTQRDLAAMKLISAPALVAFEKGRAWPRDKTRAKLEQIVKWPPGTLSKLNNGGQAPTGGGKEARHDDAIELLAGAVTMAAGPVLASVDTLPDSDDPAFPARARAVLADLRQLEALTARAVRTSQGSGEVLKLLREIRHRYDAVMERAASAPGATLGQRLYVARVAATFSVAEAAGAADVAPEVVTAAEAEQQVSDTDQRQLEKLIAELTG
jgi:transcriptional regulator with XRE-family HTH domain